MGCGNETLLVSVLGFGFLGSCLAETARNAARFSFWLLVFGFVDVDWRFGNVLSVLGFCAD